MRHQFILVMAVLVAVAAIACSQTEPPTPGPAAATTAEVANQRLSEAAPKATSISTAQAKKSPEAIPPPSTSASPAENPPASKPAQAKESEQAPGTKLTGRVDWGSLASLFSERGVDVPSGVEKVSASRLDGLELAIQDGADSFSFNLPPGAAYLLKAKSTDGVNLWAITPVLTHDMVHDISLQTTYQAGLIYAAAGGGTISSESVVNLKEESDAALGVGADRLVNTVKRVVHNALLWKVDYSIVTEVNQVSLRAFGGGLDPVRSLENVVNEPEPDYVPHVYMLNTAAGDLFLDRILMSEMKASRWATIVVAESIPSRVYGGLGGLHIVHGGTTLAYGEGKCFTWKGTECQSYRQVIVTHPLDAPPDASPTIITAVADFDGADQPQWPWDERKIAFQAFPGGRLTRAQIYVMNRDGSGVTQLTSVSNGQNGATVPSWSPDNSRIVYVSDVEAFSWDIWTMNSDGSGQRNLTKGRLKFPNEPQFSPDGRRILFYANDNATSTPRRGGPDSELWVMDVDGSGLTKITDNETDDESPVWGLNGVDVIYSASKGTWEAANVFNGEKLFEFPEVARGRYVSPVLAATEHVLVPTEDAVEAGQVDQRGYVNDGWLDAKVAAEPDIKVRENKRVSGYRVTTPSKDPISGIRYEIWTAFTQTPIYQSNVGGWTAPIINW